MAGVTETRHKAELWGRVQLWREALWSEEPVGGASATRVMEGGGGCSLDQDPAVHDG